MSAHSWKSLIDIYNVFGRLTACETQRFLSKIIALYLLVVALIS